MMELSTTVTKHSARDHPESRDHDGNTSSQRMGAESREQIERREPEGPFPPTQQVIYLMVGVCLQVFCVALDNTIISTAIPKITTEFHSLSDIAWYSNAYLLAQSVVTLLYGKLYTLYGVKWVYLFALLCFQVGSVVCGTARSSNALIVGRACAGLGGGGLTPGSLLIITKTVPLHRRPAFLGIVGCMGGIAAVLGPLLGGIFTDRVSWRWCFYINLPFGFVTAVFISFFFRNGTPVKRRTRGWRLLLELDLVGSFFFVPAVICLLLALQWGGQKFPWHSVRIIVLLVLCGILLIAWVLIQMWQTDTASVPPRLMCNRNLAGAIIHALMLCGAFYIFSYYFPLWFQAVKESTATMSGIMSLPTIIGMISASILGGILVTLIGYYTPVMYAGSIILTIGAGLCTTLTVASGHSHWIGYQAMVGIGSGLGYQQPIVAVQTCLDAEDVPVGTALITFMQTLSGAVFLAAAQNVFQNKLIANVVRDVPHVSPAEVIGSGVAQLQNRFPAEVLPALLRAYNQAVVRGAFIVGVAAAGLSILGPLCMEWVSVKTAKEVPKDEDTPREIPRNEVEAKKVQKDEEVQ